MTKREERAEEKPSELGTETPTASWPFFGRLPQRTHYLGGPIEDLDPPFKVLWHINTHALIEFPPAISGGVAYLVNKYGNVYAVRLSDKKILWRGSSANGCTGRRSTSPARPTPAAASSSPRSAAP